MKKLLIVALFSLFVFGCTEKQSTHAKMRQNTVHPRAFARFEANRGWSDHKFENRDAPRLHRFENRKQRNDRKPDFKRSRKDR